MFDLVISGGTVIDGTAAPRRRADVGIRKDRIAAVADDLSAAEAGHRIDATDRIVTPGFVDLRRNRSRSRGSVKEGWIADLSVIDYEALETGYPYYVNDFPHNGGRYIVESQGYAATLVGGQVIVENGKHTGNRPGRVIREFAHG